MPAFELDTSADQTDQYTTSTTVEDLHCATDIVEKLNNELCSGAIMNTPEFRQEFTDLAGVVCEVYMRLVEQTEPNRPIIVEESYL